MKEIKDFDGYFVERDGSVWCNLGRGYRGEKSTRGRVELYLLKPRLARNGYLRVYMRQTSTNKRVDRYVHRLVAEAFLSHDDAHNVVNHKNCDRTDNRVDNLEWTDHRGNNAYSMSLGHLVRDDKTGRFCSNVNTMV